MKLIEITMSSISSEGVIRALSDCYPAGTRLPLRAFATRRHVSFILSFFSEERWVTTLNITSDGTSRALTFFSVRATHVPTGRDCILMWRLSRYTVDEFGLEDNIVFAVPRDRPYAVLSYLDDNGAAITPFQGAYFTI